MTWLLLALNVLLVLVLVLVVLVVRSYPNPEPLMEDATYTVNFSSLCFFELGPCDDATAEERAEMARRNAELQSWLDTQRIIRNGRVLIRIGRPRVHLVEVA